MARVTKEQLEERNLRLQRAYDKQLSRTISLRTKNESLQYEVLFFTVMSVVFMIATFLLLIL